MVVKAAEITNDFMADNTELRRSGSSSRSYSRSYYSGGGVHVSGGTGSDLVDLIIFFIVLCVYFIAWLLKKPEETHSVPLVEQHVVVEEHHEIPVQVNCMDTPTNPGYGMPPPDYGMHPPVYPEPTVVVVDHHDDHYDHHD